MEEGAKNIQTVLLVEDSDDDAFFFERAFQAADTRTKLVRLIDGGAAVEYLERGITETPDFVARHLMFLDLKLPVLSGFDVLQWIAERKLPLDVVVLSGSDLQGDTDLAKGLGAAEYFVKPISSEQIRKRILQSQEVHER